MNREIEEQALARSLFDLTDRVAVVTGAASGLGRAMAVGLASFGADVVGSDIDGPGLAETLARVTALGGKGLAVQCDNSKPEDIRRLFEEVDQAFEHVDILVNNVGIGSRCHPEDLSLDDWNRVIQVNLTGSFLCVQEAGRRMIARKHGGSIINTGSIAGVSALGRGNFVYSITKGALVQFTRELAVEWAKQNIRVNMILPAQMRTPILESWLASDSRFNIDQFLRGIPLNRLGEAKDIIGPAVFLASDASAFITGVMLPLDGGNLALNAGGSRDW
jgi:NAD(P)-dependent dehydrogenase (short-subunit alcohol dehydrogenase family)